MREKKSSSGKTCRNWHRAIENTMNKCLYCGKKIEKNITYCSDECKTEYEKSVRRDEGKARLFAVGIAAGVFLILAGVFVAWTPLIGAAIGLMGLTVIGLPLATSETIGWLGYRPARRLARALGGCWSLWGSGSACEWGQAPRCAGLALSGFKAMT